MQSEESGKNRISRVKIDKLHLIWFHFVLQYIFTTFFLISPLVLKAPLKMENDFYEVCWQKRTKDTNCATQWNIKKVNLSWHRKANE